MGCSGGSADTRIYGHPSVSTAVRSGRSKMLNICQDILNIYQEEI